MASLEQKVKKVLDKISNLWYNHSTKFKYGAGHHLKAAL